MRYDLIASGAGVLGFDDKAADNSLRNTIMMELEFVTKLSRVSAGRLRDRLEERDTMNFVNICWQAFGKETSVGTIGVYHHL